MISTVDRVRACSRLAPYSSCLSFVAMTVIALLTFPSSAHSTLPEPPNLYAISGATVHTGTGEVLENANVIIVDGLIEAVGDVEVPPDAWRIEAQGLTLYPGLIDSLTTLGQASASEDDDASGSDRVAVRGPEDRPRTTPWIVAGESLSDDPRIEKWRNAGFTTALTAPTSGIFPGAASLIHLGTAEPRMRILEPVVGQRINLARGGRSYPGSLMGVLAYLEQVFLDARHAAAVDTSYRNLPRGQQRPEYDRTLGPINRAFELDKPFLFPANRATEIDRAVDLASRLDLDLLLVGGHGGYARLDALASAGFPVLVDLDWPEAEKDRDPEADTSFADLYHRRFAVTTPAKLAEADLPFAFYSNELASPADIFANIRAAIDVGLAPSRALSALTSTAADILGVGDRLGSIEPGKIANLVLADAQPWAEDVEIVAVFIEGRKYQQPPEEDHDPPTADASGLWELSLQSPRGARELTAELEMSEDGSVSGELTSSRGTSTIEDGRMSGDLLRFTVTRSMEGRTIEASYSLTIEDESASGSVSAGPMTMDISGARTRGRDAAADSTNTDDGGETDSDVSLAELEQVMQIYRGPVGGRSQTDTFAIINATIHPVSGPPIADGVVVVEAGKIAAVGPADILQPPAGVDLVDAQGGNLIPGIIDAHSHIAIEGGVNEGTLAVTSMVEIGDVIDPEDIAIYRALAGGVTSANLLHGSANPIGGQNAVIKLRWGSDAAGLKLEGAPPGIKFALGENPKRSNFRTPGSEQRHPQSRMGVMDVIRQAFVEARQYREQWLEYQRSTTTTRSKRGKRTTEPPKAAPRRDLRLEPLVEILEGTRLVHSHCYRADEILQLMRLAEEQGFKIATLQHVLEGFKVADEIAAHGAGASTFSDWWGYKVEAFDAIPHNAALMTERGVVVSINSDSAEEMRHLNQEAAKTMKWGDLASNDALALITLNPAIQLGIDDHVGSIEVGKDADLVLYDGDPLAISSVVQQTWIDGVLYFDLEADRERQRVIDEIKRRLVPASDSEQTDDDSSESSDKPAKPNPTRATNSIISEQETF